MKKPETLKDLIELALNNPEGTPYTSPTEEVIDENGNKVKKTKVKANPQ